MSTQPSMGQHNEMIGQGLTPPSSIIPSAKTLNGPYVLPTGQRRNSMVGPLPHMSVSSGSFTHMVS